MSLGRYTKHYVGMQDHPVVGIERDRAYTQYEAWQWLINHAAWKAHPVNVKGIVRTLEVGQLLGGRDHLAKTWRWSAKRVRLYLVRLMSHGMLELGQSRGRFPNVVIINNYSIYQGLEEAEGPVEGPVEGRVEGQLRASRGPHSIQGVTGITGSKDSLAPAREIFSASPASPAEAPDAETKINPMRKRDPLCLNPDAAPEAHGLSFDGGLHAINGSRHELAGKFAGGDEIKLDAMLTQVQGFAGIKLGIHGQQLRFNVEGALARLNASSSERKQTSRENYDRGRAEGKRDDAERRDAAPRRDGSPPKKAAPPPQAPTNDPREMRKRFDVAKQHDAFWRERYRRDGYTSTLKDFEGLCLKAWNRHNAQLAANR